MMEENDDTKRLMRLYFGKHFSRYGRVLFGRWLRASDDKPRKEELLREIWDASAAEASEATGADWARLRERLPAGISQEHSIPFYRRYLRYAAVAGLMILTAGMTYWAANHRKLTHRVEMAQVFVPYGESKQIVLPDGSEVWAAAGSLLVYPKEFTDMDSRTVYLAGEASFAVQKNPEQPFLVKTTNMEVQALGTVFTVEAYPGDTCSMAMLEEGSVLVSVSDTSIQPSILKPDQQLIYSHSGHTVTVQSVDASLYQMERNGYMVFEDTPFNRLIGALERKFNVTIHYNSQKYAGEYYTVKFSPDETLDDVLDILRQLVGIRFKVNGNVVFIN